MLPFSRIKHICFNFREIEETEALFTKTLRVRSTGITTLSLDGQNGVVKNTFFHLEKGSIELACHDLPESWRDSPINTGLGFHHIAFEVPNFDESLSELARMGITPLPQFPFTTLHGRVAFFHPEQTGGILCELGEMKK